VDCYIDVQQQEVDCKVASALCIGGPIKCVLKEGSGLSLSWLLEEVVPGIAFFLY
jgi:hypothetical protein